MKVTCEKCEASFKVKGEVSAGKTFKFKCPKCGTVNRLVAGESSAEPVKAPPKVKCENCGESILPPEEGPPLCDQCRASRAVEEARQKSQELMEDSEMDFPDDIFDGGEETLPGFIDATDEAPTEEEPEEEAEEEAEEEGVDVPMPFDDDEESEPAGEETELSEDRVEESAEEKPVDLEKVGYEIRSKDGLVIGPVKLGTLRDLIIAKKVHSDEECRRDNGDWMSVLEFPEIFEIFEAHKALEEDDTTVATSAEEEREKLLESLKVKKECEGCGAEIYVLEDIPHPLCDQCRIEALVTKKQQAMGESGPRYKVRTPDGLVLGPLRRNTLEDLVTAGNIHGPEEVSIDGGDWRQILDVEELADLFEEEDMVIDLTETIDG